MRSLVFVLAIRALHVQPSSAASCRSDLDFVIAKTEANYAGFRDKVRDDNRQAYVAATSTARARADSTHDDSACLGVLKDWLHFFHDGHIDVRMPHDRSAPGREIAPTRPTLERLDGQTLLLRLPSFQNEQGALVSALVSQHEQELSTVPNLIVDVRGNGGGSDFVWMPVYRFLYTQPVVAVNSSILSTPDNVAKYDGLLADSTIPSADKADIRAFAEQLRAHPGELVRRADDTLRLPAVMPMPKRVAVVTDKRCWSSCEGFVLAVEQSGKTCLVGEHTGGVLDYANQWHLAVPESPFVFWYPTSRSQRLPQHPVDPDGIAPDIPVRVDEPQTIDRVRELIEQRGEWRCHPGRA